MQYQNKKLWLVALASALALGLVSGCTGKDDDKKGKEEFEFDTVSATVWKNFDKAAFNNGTVTQVVVSGANTYAATSDQGLFVLAKNGGTWEKVDLNKGMAPGGAVALPEAGLNIKHLTAISSGRVIFGVDGGANSIIIAEGNVAKRTWQGANLVGNEVTSFVAAMGADNKERIFAANDQATVHIFMQLDSSDATLTAAWDTSLVDAAGNLFSATPLNRIKQLTLNHDGSELVFSKENLRGYDTIPKANWVAAGRATSAENIVLISGRNDPAAAAWDHTNIPDQIVFTAADKAVFKDGNDVGYSTVLAAPTSANVAVTLAGVTAVNKLIKVANDDVKVLTKEGMFTIDGTKGTEVANSKFTGAPTGDNFLDEGKTAAQLESMKKADLKAANFGTTDIRDMAKSGTTTFYVTDKGVSVGKPETLKLNKRKKSS